jgi:hypothetical protein
MNLEDPGRVRGERRLKMSFGFVESSRGEGLAAELKRILRSEREKRDEGEHHRESTGTGVQHLTRHPAAENVIDDRSCCSWRTGWTHVWIPDEATGAITIRCCNHVSRHSVKCFILHRIARQEFPFVFPHETLHEYRGVRKRVVCRDVPELVAIG